MKTEHTIAQLCATLEVSASGYFAWVKAPASQREQQDAELLPHIRAIHAQHKGRYGAPRIQDAISRIPKEWTTLTFRRRLARYIREKVTL